MLRSIDEAIEQFKYDAKNKQIAEWLEELKAYREIGTVEGYKSAIECYTEEYNRRKSNEQYNKAIDDFVNVCKSNILCQTFGLRQCDIEKIAEQLKAGGENE